MQKTAPHFATKDIPKLSAFCQLNLDVHYKKNTSPYAIALSKSLFP